LLEVAAGIRPADAGEVWLGEVELTGLSEEGRAELLGRDISQEHAVLKVLRVPKDQPAPQELPAALAPMVL
jgi:predicted ABC-type transport system involved in lysophospholipase L1 biosynthesis ATPase subunit